MNAVLMLTSPLLAIVLTLALAVTAGVALELRARAVEVGEREAETADWAARLWREEAQLRAREASLRWAGGARWGR